MEIRRYELGPLRANSYIIINKDRKAIAVDVGGDAGFLMMEELKHGFEITDIDSVMNGNIQGFINDYLKKSQ